MAHVVDALEVGAEFLDVGPQTRKILERLIETGQQRLKGDQDSEGHDPHRDLVTAQAQDHDRGHRGQERRQHQEKRIADAQGLFGIDHPRLVAGPPHQEV